MGLLDRIIRRFRRYGDRTNWQIGDLAECVVDGPWYARLHLPWMTDPRRGEIRMVAGVSHDPRRKMTFLTFDRYRPFGYQSEGFRKIVPRADRAEPGTAAGLDDLRPAPSRIQHLPLPERTDA